MSTMATPLTTMATPLTAMATPLTAMGTPSSKRSLVWEYCKKINAKEVSCNFCGAVFKFHGATSSLWKHIKCQHLSPEELERVQYYVPKKAPKSQKGRTKKLKSKVWLYYEKTTPLEVTCKMCSAKFKFNRSTSTMMGHLKRQHSREVPDIMDVSSSQQEDSIMQVVESLENESQYEPFVATTSMSVNSSPKATKIESGYYAETENHVSMKPEPRLDMEKKQSLDRRVLYMILADLQPFSVLENEGFRRLVKDLRPSYSLPSQTSLMNHLLPGLCREMNNTVFAQLQSAISVSISAEVWQHIFERTYLSVTAHFISNNWEHQSIMLGSAKLPENYSGQNLADELYRMFENWQISSKVFCVTTDGSSEMSSAVAHLNINHQVCYAVNIKMVVENAINNIPGLEFLKEKVTDVFSFFLSNESAHERLVFLQREQGNSPLEVEDMDKTAWMWFFHMLQRYIELHTYVTAVLNDLGRQDITISGEDYNSMKECVQALEPFELVTKELAFEGFVSLSKMIPMSRTLAKFLNNSRLTGELALELKNQLSQRFMELESDMICSAATYLDPRFKKLPFDNVDTWTNVHNELKNMMEMFQQQTPATTSQPDNPRMSKVHEATMSLWSEFDEQVQAASSTDPNRLKFNRDDEFARYDTEAFIMRLKSPVKWWKTKEKMYPSLCRLAKQFLGVPATSVCPEVLFTKEGQLKLSKRYNLKESSLKSLLFLHGNRKLLRP